MPRRTLFTLAAATAVCIAAAAMIVLVHTSRDPVDTANVLSADIAVVGLAITALTILGAWWRTGRPGQVATSSQAVDAADRLAMEMADRWHQEAARRRIANPAPVPVRWRWAASGPARHDVAATPAAGTAAPPLPGPGKPGEVLGAGVVTRIHDELYSRLPHGRLVLLGGPGSGKTGTMILLMLAA